MRQDPRLAGVRLQRGPGEKLSWATPLTIADVTFELHLPGQDWWAALETRLGDYRRPGPGGVPLVLELEPGLIRVDEAEPVIEAREGALTLRFDQYAGRVEEDGTASLRIGERGPGPSDLTYVMAVDSLLRMQLAQRLAQRGGLLMHASGIVGPDGLGHVFFGPSGSGKTTMCRLSSPNLTILCDEVVAVLTGAEGPEVHGTPFSGAWGHSVPASRPLAALHRLRHAPETHLTPLEPGRAIREILESTVYYDQSPAGIATVLDLVSRLVEAVQVDELAFEPKEQVWETLSKHLPGPRVTSRA